MDEKTSSLPLSRNWRTHTETADVSSRSTGASMRSDLARRVTLFAALLFAFSYVLWKWCTQPPASVTDQSLATFIANAHDTFETTTSYPFDGTRILDLDPQLLPGGKYDKRGDRRLIFVGDIHGCAEELRALLRKVDFDSQRDHLIAVGDVISKGPDSTGVLDIIIDLDAASVRGNHEDRILSLARSSNSDSSVNVTSDDNEDDSETFAGDPELLKQLSPAHLRYLERMPLMLRVPPLPQASRTSYKSDSPIGEEILVVHAGLVPAVSLEKQDPYFVMNMRSIHTKTHKPLVEAQSKAGKSKPWHDIWCWYNERLSKHKSIKDFAVDRDEQLREDSFIVSQLPGTSWLERLFSRHQSKYPEPQVVIYGHHSKEGLQLQRWSKGLDTGCVRGGKLTALVLGAKGKQEIVHVKCKDNRA